MAVLNSKGLSFDFRYTGFDDGWIQYQFYFRWKGESVIRDDLLKRNSEYWSSRSEGAFLANEDVQDGLLPLVKRVLDEDKADYWEPIEPDILVAIYPGGFFPFLPSHMRVVYESEEHKAKRRFREHLKKEVGKLDDLFTFLVSVDAFNFREAGGYLGQGLVLNMIVRRRDLETFATDLEKEYQAFKKKYDMDGWSDDCT